MPELVPLNVILQDAVPRYAETDESGFFTRLEVFQNNHPDYPIVPVTKHPDAPGTDDAHENLSCTTKSWDTTASSDAHDLQADIVNALFESIALKKDAAAVHHLISQGLISPDCPDKTGETPLLAAIRQRKVATARALLSLGAQTNLSGTVGADATVRPPPQTGRERTPLMLAAAMGNLVLVKVLVEEHGADDGVVGPEGEIALRLAADAGHRDVVRYLPPRRRGAWRRLKCSKEVRRARRAVAAAGRVGAVKAMAKALWTGVKGLSRFVLLAIVWTLKSLPRAWEVMWKWLVDGVKRVGRAVAFAALRLVSMLCSLVTAVISRLEDITLKDVGHDLLVAMEALFVKLPQAVWSFLYQSVAVAVRAAKAFLGNGCVRLLFEVVCRIPKTLWSMLESLLESIARGMDELITLLNPKRVRTGETR
ncbi:hypothetical protein diail_9057 [Diaporthe ilicicola]|nr:hypothetical protein diail_9057 [Diaporthe ilicicola]